MLFSYTPKKQKDWQENVSYTLKFNSEYMTLYNNNGKYDICKIPLGIVVRVYFADPQRLPLLIQTYTPRNVRLNMGDYESIIRDVSQYIDNIA